MKQYCRLHRQSGHAAILFALFIPFLFGVFTLGTDGARAVQDKARLLEAVEVASLAVAGQGSDDAALAKNYLEYYFPSATINNNDIQIKKINCEDNVNCKNSNRRFFEYQVSAQISQPTWFPGNDAIIGFGENYAVGGHSSARKYHAKTVDVMFVADFSGSMSGSWDGKVKYEALIQVIKDVNKELESFNQALVKLGDTVANRSAFTAYDNSTFMPTGKKYCNVNHYKSNVKNTINAIFKENICTGNKINSADFYSIPITSEFSAKIDDVISNFKPRGKTTASYQGLIDAAYIAYSIPKPNPRQLIIILSDGEDYPQSEATRMTNLVDENMCQKIIKKLQSRKSLGSENIEESVKARMAMIAFSYEVPNDSGLVKCVGKDNVFQANDFNAIKNKILELITEEIGHLAL